MGASYRVLARCWHWYFRPNHKPAGIADNGDFAKIIGKFDLKAPVDDSDDRLFTYIHLRYTSAPANYWAGPKSSTTIVS